jgi:mRNA-degrading endonuclease toxin of MazEF toxin-antitoxin module
MKNALIACALIGASFFAAPAFADTAGPSQAEAVAALQAEPIAPVTDRELRNYAAAQVELDGLYPSPMESVGHATQIRMQTAAALSRHSLTATRYNEITTALDVNANLAQRFAAISNNRGPGV